MSDRRKMTANERVTLDKATKRQKARYPQLSWKRCRSLALIWCTKMWPDFAGVAQSIKAVRP